MAWTEITRRHYRRDALRYASDLTDAEWTLIAPFLPAASKLVRAAEKDEPPIGGRCDLVYRLDRLPVARDPQGLSALLDGAG